ncbi:hypothetical protein [Rhizobium sp. TRM95796]|uniref:hypothetical protein n=1 Tax=Rhizobium sp. TRM95796 TaxID=2979862 RepID=UPI0021E6EECB|nr:hypothetical protein [Rhizobium sp. TRM95796]MCV3768723.1 hypothetical protein [Rhizobium sp. TRM95796]
MISMRLKSLWHDSAGRKGIGRTVRGSVAATLALSEVLRLLHGGPLKQMIDINLLSLEHRVALHHQGEFAGFNPGFVMTSS